MEVRYRPPLILFFVVIAQFGIHLLDGSITLSFKADCPTNKMLGKEGFNCTCVGNYTTGNITKMVWTASDNASFSTSQTDVKGERTLTMQYDFNKNDSKGFIISCHVILERSPGSDVKDVKRVNVKFLYVPDFITPKSENGSRVDLGSTVHLSCYTEHDAVAPPAPLNVQFKLWGKIINKLFKCTNEIDKSAPLQKYNCGTYLTTQAENLTMQCHGKHLYAPTFPGVTSEGELLVTDTPRAEVLKCPIRKTPPIFVDPDNLQPCLCSIRDEGYPKTQTVTWDLGNGQTIEGQKSVVLKYTRPVSEKEKTFACIVNNTYHRQTYNLSVKWAYGPGKVYMIRYEDHNNIVLGGDKVYLACLINPSQVYPAFNLSMTITFPEDKILENPKITQLVPFHKYEYTYQPLQSGLFKAKCLAINSEIADKNSSIEVDFFVKDNSSIVLQDCPNNMTNTSDISCICNVTDPGYPPAEPSWFDSQGNRVATGKMMVDLSVSTAHSGQTFYCQANSSYGVSQMLEYKVSYIFGPENVTIVHDKGNTTKERAMFYCEVNTSSTFPDWTTKFQVYPVGKITKYSHRVVDDQQGVTRDYYAFDTSNIKNGNFTAECMVNNTKIVSIGAVSTLDYTVEELPSANITDCLVYDNMVAGKTPWIQAGLGEPIDCDCTITNPGFPKFWTKAQWVDGNSGDVIKEGKHIANMLYTRKPEEKSKSLQCQAVNSAGVSKINTSFTVYYYYGPANVSLRLMETSKFDGKNTPAPANLSVYCDVPSDLNPSISVKVMGTNSKGVTVVNVSQPIDRQDSAVKQTFKFSFPPPLDDKKLPDLAINITCTAENDINSSLSVEDSMQLEMPTLQLTGCPSNTVGSIHAVETLKHSANCTCRLSIPGTPKSEMRWVDAQGATMTSGDLEAVLHVNSSDHNSTFTCQALALWSVVRQIPFTPQFKVIPDKPPKIELTFVDDLKHVSNGSTIDIDVGESLRVMCKVDGGIPVVSNITLTYGSKTITVNGTEVSRELVIDKSFNQVTFSCSAEHETGHYKDVTSFLLNVLQPAVIQSYAINNQTALKVEVNEGEEVTFDCLAEGNPAPIMALKGLLTNVIPKWQITAVGVNSRRILGTFASANVSDTDTFICTAVSPSKAKRRRKKRCAEEVAKSPEKKATDLIIIGAPLPTFPKDKPPEARSRIDGQLLVEVEVISHPKPTSYIMAKVREVVNDQEIYTEIPREQYVVEFTPMNCRIATVKLWAIDFDVNEGTRYRFTINNEKGAPTHIYLGTRKEEEPGSEYRRIDDEHFKIAISLSILHFLVIMFVIIALVTYIYWIRKGKGNLKYKKTKGGRGRPQRGFQYPPQMYPRMMWWQNY